jgi:hypothetical protein
MKEPKRVVSEYAAVSGTNLESFTNTVNGYIEEGWELHGSMKYCVTPDHHQWFAQSFVKKTEEDTRGAWG